MINSGAISKIDLIENLDKIKDQIINLIKSHAIKISENSQLEDIARISSNSDESISKLVYEAFMSAGEKGIVTVDINTNPSDQLKVSDGMKLFTGLCAPQFINKRSTSECVLENLVVFITEDNLVSQKDAVHILKLALEHKKPLLVFAPVIAGEALATFIANKEQGIVECCCVTYPMYGAVRSEVIEELCAITGAMSISLAAGTAITSAKKEHFGILKKASITVGNTLLTRDPNVSTERLDTIVADIKEKLKSCNINEAAKYSIRLERLCGTIVEIMVGGMTKVEVEERKDRFVDAISAVRAALEEGVVIGGGRELYNISNALELDEKFEFLRNVLKAPHNLILESSGIVPESPYPSDDVGYNAKTKEIGNMFEMGIVDPAKVTMTGIANSFSVVKVLLSTNVVLINQE
jgi:chaperonin GroEL